MVIAFDDLEGVDELVARRVLVLARSIAPCIDTLEAEPREDAIAILMGVVAELPAAGEARARSMSRNGSSITFAAIQSAFDDDARAALRSLCASASPAGLPVGSFPDSASFGRVWPETYTS